MIAHSSNTRRVLIIIGLLLTLVVPNLPIGTWGKHYSGLGPLFGTEILWWVLILIVLGYVLFVERRSLRSIGFHRPTWKTLLWGVIAGVVLIAGIVLSYALVFPLFHLKMNASAYGKIFETPLWYRLALVIRAAVCEEILFRGYPIERLQELSGSRWLAAIVSWTAFTYAHLGYWGAAQLIVAGFGGVVLTALYLWRRDLSCNMLAHFIADGAGFLFR